MGGGIGERESERERERERGERERAREREKGEKGDIWLLCSVTSGEGLQTDRFGSRNNISMLKRNILNSQFRP